jgi:hypothetical protein
LLQTALLAAWSNLVVQNHAFLGKAYIPVSAIPANTDFFLGICYCCGYEKAIPQTFLNFLKMPSR